MGCELLSGGAEVGRLKLTNAEGVKRGAEELNLGIFIVFLVLKTRLSRD